MFAGSNAPEAAGTRMLMVVNSVVSDDSATSMAMLSSRSGVVKNRHAHDCGGDYVGQCGQCARHSFTSPTTQHVFDFLLDLFVHGGTLVLCRHGLRIGPFPNHLRCS